MAPICWNLRQLFRRFRKGGGTKQEEERERVNKEQNRCQTLVERIREREQCYKDVERLYNNLMLVFSCMFLVFLVSGIFIALFFHFACNRISHIYPVILLAVTGFLGLVLCIGLISNRMRRIWNSIEEDAQVPVTLATFDSSEDVWMQGPFNDVAL